MNDASEKIRGLVQIAIRTMAKIEMLGPQNCHALIACSKTKVASYRESARNMYTSPLYKKSVLVAETWGVPFSILSAKYGLLDPSTVIETYDLTLKGKNSQYKAEWA